MPKASEAIPIGMASTIILSNDNDHVPNLGSILLINVFRIMIGNSNNGYDG